MYFATLYKARTDITAEQAQQILPRRMQWKPKAHIISEYWFLGAQRGDWVGITIADVKESAELFEDLAVWSDVLDLQTHPAIGVEDGLRMAQKVAAAAAA